MQVQASYKPLGSCVTGPGAGDSRSPREFVSPAPGRATAGAHVSLCHRPRGGRQPEPT